MAAKYMSTTLYSRISNYRLGPRGPSNTRCLSPVLQLWQDFQIFYNALHKLFRLQNVFPLRPPGGHDQEADGEADEGHLPSARQGAALQAAEDDQAEARRGDRHPPDPLRSRLHRPHREADQEDRGAD